MIKFENLCAGYGKHQILDNIDLEIKNQAITTIIGPNGCGKTTLLKSLIGMCDILSGNVFIDNKNINSITNSECAKKIAYLPQGKSTPETTVGEIVIHGRFPYLSFPRKYSKSDYEKADTTMKKMGILQYADKNMCELSGGIRQKAYIAMALCQEAETILFDEPTTYLDISQQFKMNSLINELKQNGKSVVCVIHDIITAIKISDEIIIMNDGKIIKSGTPEEILQANIIKEVFGVEISMIQNEYFYK